MKKGITDEQFIETYRRIGSPAKVARELGISERVVFSRRAGLIAKGFELATHSPGNLPVKTQAGVAQLRIDNGVVIVGSDAHFWPDMRTAAFRGFLWACRELKPSAVVINGDMFDGASISRHPPIGWEKRPSVIQELEAVTERLQEIQDAANGARRFWPLGNHDARYESRLAAVAPEYREVKGVHLKDHFPEWFPCWRVDVNDDIVIKHRLNGGVNATHTNTVRAGKTIVTGHLHALRVSPFTDYRSTRFGIDCGTLADVDGPQFNDYMEAGPANWRSGFAVLTIKNGVMLWPELIAKYDDEHIQFRGAVIPV